MRRFSFLKYVLSAGIIIVLVSGALYFPKLYNYRQDSNNFNKVHTYKQEEISLYEGADISVYDRMKELIMMLNTADSGGSAYYVVHLEDFNKEYFIEQVIKEIGRASECGLIPDLSSYNLEDGYNIQCFGIEVYDSDLADYKCLSVEFLDDMGEYNFRFIIDYDTYMIYQAELYCEEWRSSNNFEEYTFNSASTSCMQYYMPDEIRSYSLIETYSEYISFKMMYGEDYLFFSRQILYDESMENIIGITVGIFI